MTSKLKLYYYTSVYDYDLTHTETKHPIFFASSALYLNSYIRVCREDLYDIVEWQKLQFFNLTQDQLINDLIKFDVDVLCLSLYIWNAEHILKLLSGIKKLLPKDIVIVVGGPSVDVIKNKNFLNQNPDIDYAVYSQGEKAFVNVLDHILGIQKLSLLHSRNVAWRDKGKTKLADFEFVRLEKISPYLLSAELMEKTVNDPYYKDTEFILAYETSKGCPYDCSFCDWTSGLTNKTYYRKFDIEAELDLIGKLGIFKLSMSDANFGQIKQDLEVAETLARLRREKNYKFEIFYTNFSKLKKERAFEIADIFVTGELVSSLKFAVQDIHDFILKNIDRPDIPWEEHKKYIDNIRTKHKHIDLYVELIQGLPGQTRKTWEETLISIMPYKPIIHPWIILPNSPAGSIEYQEKMQIKYISSDVSARHKTENVNALNTVFETYSYTFDDYSYFTLLSELCVDSVFDDLHKKINRRFLFDKIKQSKHLNNTLAKIKNALPTNNARKIIQEITISFIKLLVIEFYKELPIEFVKTFVKKVHY